MRGIIPLSVLIILFLMESCQSASEVPAFEKMLRADAKLDSLLSLKADHHIHIIYTQIDRDSANQPHFTTFQYGSDSTYFYPASTVKLPVAALALEKLRQLGIPRLDIHTPMITDSAFSGQTRVSKDSTAQNGLPSIGHYIHKLFVVSDNDAFNRLYEFLGQGLINDRLRELGYRDTRIVHRLAVAMTREENASCNPIKFGANGRWIYDQLTNFNPATYSPSSPILLGKGEMIQGKLVEGPKDFTYKNAFPLAEQQLFLRNLLFPQFVPSSLGLRLTEADYQLLYREMSMLPRESQHPSYDSSLYDAYGKFLMFGTDKAPIPDHIRIFNKIGAAYGFLTDNAYIVDFEHNIEFLLSATIYVNENGIFNDDIYGYETIGFPFMQKLGQAVYAHELMRERKYVPDLRYFEDLFLDK